jgi:hypothetical protein
VDCTSIDRGSPLPASTKPTCRPTTPPRHRAGGDVIDPAALGIGRDQPAFALGSVDEHLAVVAAGDRRRRHRSRRQDAAAMQRKQPLVALGGTSSTRLLAQHEGCGATEKMCRHHRRAGREPRGVRSTTEGVLLDVSVMQ